MISGVAVLIPAVYGAGLATGLLHFGVPGCLAALLAAGLVQGRPAGVLAAGTFALACVTGAVAAARDASSCRARLPVGRVELTVRLMDAPTAALVRVQPIGAGCWGAVDARWPHGTKDAAGSIADVRGRWIPRPARGGRVEGVLAVAEIRGRRSASPTAAELVRGTTVARARALYGERAPLVDALVLGTRGGIDGQTRDDFARSGLVHLLSISGFHVGLISAWVVLLLRLGGVPRTRALTAGAAVGTVYVAFLGFPAPATRAAALTILLALQFKRQRRVQPNALLACTCLTVLLVDPWAIFDLGGWLSATALWGATTATRWSDVAFGEGFFTRTLSSSIGAAFATAPVTAAMLGAVAMAGIVLNIAAIPIAAVAVPGVLASLLLEPISGAAAAALAAGSGLLLHGLEVLARAGATVPIGHVVVAEELRSALPWLAILAAMLWSIGPRNTRLEAVRRGTLTVAVWTWLSVLSTLRSSGNAEGLLALHFLDVGQGDAAAIRTPTGRWVLVDAGPRAQSFDAGRRIVVPFLARHRARSIAAVVISHAHLDHLGGAEAVLDRFGAGVVLDPAADFPEPAYTSFLGALEATGTAWKPVRSGLTFALDGVEFSVIHPDTGWVEWGSDVNEDSAVLRIRYGDFTAILAGDAGFPAEARMRTRAGRADVLKVGHHGSAGSTGDDWLTELRPAVGVISVGRNRYGHPAPAALQRLRLAGVDVWRTDLEGTVSITTDGSVMRVRGRRGTVTRSVE